MSDPRPAWFDNEMLACGASLKAFALKLCWNATHAEDLVQQTFFKALRSWQHFEQGTSMKAWLFSILRNELFSQGRRKSGKELSDPDGIFAEKLFVNEGQSWVVDLKVVRKRMRMLPPEMRRALELVGIEQHSYEDAAAILGAAAVGTVKSRVSRARAYLESGDDSSLLDEPEQVVATVDLSVAYSDEQAIERLYRAGRSIAEIKAELTGVSRSDIMRVVVERKLSR